MPRAALLLIESWRHHYNCFWPQIGLRHRPLAPEVVILSSSAAPFGPQPGPEMHAAERSQLHRPPQPRRGVASTVRNITVRLELDERRRPRVAAGGQLELRIEKRSKGNSDRE